MSVVLLNWGFSFPPLSWPHCTCSYRKQVYCWKKKLQSFTNAARIKKCGFKWNSWVLLVRCFYGRSQWDLRRQHLSAWPTYLVGVDSHELAELAGFSPKVLDGFHPTSPLYSCRHLHAASKAPKERCSLCLEEGCSYMAASHLSFSPLQNKTILPVLSKGFRPC